MIYVLSFILLVAVIGLVTAKLNTKTPCNHDWHEHGNTCKCSKCGKSIPNYVSSYSEAA
jgi:hypothetical protein